MPSLLKRSSALLRMQGFTLIELSVVLVIIGGLVGGILVAQSLIRQSQISSIIVDMQRYTSAVKTFSEKYNALPGDMATATNYWGSQTTCPATNSEATGASSATCNGDGNGQIYQWYNAIVSTSAQNYSEMFYFWQHLTNAQLISGNYIGAPGPAGIIDSVPGSNVAKGRITGLGYSVIYVGVNGLGVTFSTTTNYGHVFFVGGQDSGSYTMNPIVTAYEAQAFDNKYDDGVPSTGAIQTFSTGAPWGTPTCALASGSTFVYNINVTGNLCAFIITTGF